MTPNAFEIQTALGCDVAKETITLFDSETGTTRTVANTAAALKAALKPYARRGDVLAICEATGGMRTHCCVAFNSLPSPPTAPMPPE